MGSHIIQRRFAKIVVTFEPREDGGLRAYSEDVPGFVLSNSDPLVVIRDVAPALEFILSSMWGTTVKADVLSAIGDDYANDEAPSSFSNRAREYVAHVS
jgi:hypothetical protein